MSPITTHVLDTALGKPAAGIEAILEKMVDGRPMELARGTTNSDGRIRDWFDGSDLTVGEFQIHFRLRDYFQSIGCNNYFYPEVVIRFEITDAKAHYHVPLLISPFGYSTYRGS